MTREEFKKSIVDNVNTYINNFYRFDSNPQIRINPDTLAVTLVNGNDMYAEIGDNDEAIESAAASHGMANQEASDFQVTQNPDFYSVKNLLEVVADDKTLPDEKSIEDVVGNYFSK